MLLLIACSGGGRDGGDAVASGASFGFVIIQEPIQGNGTYSTQEASIEICGSACVAPDNIDCAAVMPQQLDIQWRNAATGHSGVGYISSHCETTFLGSNAVTRWQIPRGDIDLEFRDNKVEIRVWGGSVPVVAGSGRKYALVRNDVCAA